MRIIFPIVLILFIFLQKRTKKIDFYKISLFLYFIFLSLRFLQGTDYINYYRAYYNEYAINSVFCNGFYNTQFEFLYNVIVSLFRTLNFSFQSLIIFISLINLFFINKFIKKFSENKLLSLLILYLVYGIVFIESALRQSMAMSIVLGMCFVGYSDKNIKKILLGSVMALMLHKSSLVACVVLITLYIIEDKLGYEKIVILFKQYYKKIFIVFLIMLILINILPYNELLLRVPGELGVKLQAYLSESSYSPISIILRIYFFITCLILISDKNYRINRNNFMLCAMYIGGYIFYFFVCKFSLLSRISAYFEIVEIILYSQIITNSVLFSNFKKILLVFYCLIINVLFIKDGLSTQKQTNYKNVSIICPYYNVFDLEKALDNMDNLVIYIYYNYR